jgi:hypothetical protein
MPDQSTKDFTIASLERWYAARGSRGMSQPAPKQSGPCYIPKCEGETRQCPEVGASCVYHWPKVIS